MTFLMWGEAPDDNEFVIAFIEHMRDGLKGMTAAAQARLHSNQTVGGQGPARKGPAFRFGS